MAAPFRPTRTRTSRPRLALALLALVATGAAAPVGVSRGEVLASALPGGQERVELPPGARVAVPVVLDLSRARRDGDLGAAQFELGYDPAVLRYDSVRAGLGGATGSHAPGAGHVRFAYAGTRVHPEPRLTLATVFLTVRAAPEGSESDLSLAFAGPPTDTRLRPYDAPLVVTGSVRVTRSPPSPARARPGPAHPANEGGAR